MIKTAAQKPEERKRYIDRCLNQYAELNKDPVVEAWRMKVDNKMTQARTSRTPLYWMARHAFLMTGAAQVVCCLPPSISEVIELSPTYPANCDKRAGMPEKFWWCVYATAEALGIHKSCLRLVICTGGSTPATAAAAQVQGDARTATGQGRMEPSGAAVLFPWQTGVLCRGLPQQVPGVWRRPWEPRLPAGAALFLMTAL